MWLVKAYAAWCPACKAHMPQFHRTAELLQDESAVDVGAINCERAAAKKLCADWLAVDAYPSLYLLNRKHGALAGEERTRAAARPTGWSHIHGPAAME